MASDNSLTQPGLPGYNLPLDYDRRGQFPNALDNSRNNPYVPMRPIPMRELSMLHIMDAITDKPGWEVKVFDDEISGRWKTEAMSNEMSDVTQKMADWVIEELRHRAKFFSQTGSVVVYEGDVVKSDTAVPQSTQLSLQSAVRELEDIPEVYKDWHPRSDDKVLDLVHPSLFPLIYGRSRILPSETVGLDNCIERCGKGVVLSVRPDHELGAERLGSYYRSGPKPYSQRFQWLPCDLSIASDGNFRITSYINNLHPDRYKGLYSIIEDVINAAIPLWNTTLTFGRALGNNDCLIRVPFERVRYDPDPDEMSDSETPQQGEDEDEDDYYERRSAWEDSVRRIILPEPGEFKSSDVPIPEKVVDLKKDYSSTGLQIIVKLANIHLTPEKPEYSGGSWHVEGQLNEHICATALYYYDSENITNSRLAFRQQSDTDEIQEVGYPQDEHSFLREVYGYNENLAVQEVGSVACIPGRLLTFPNVLQHQVQPFKLADPTKPGHRKILALFLVDPNITIISTGNIPPQQRHWWSENVVRDFNKRGDGLAKLSNELKDKVFQSVDDFPIGMEEAKEIRLELMDERGRYAAEQKLAFEQVEFSLCEH